MEEEALRNIVKAEPLDLELPPAGAQLKDPLFWNEAGEPMGLPLGDEQMSDFIKSECSSSTTTEYLQNNCFSRGLAGTEGSEEPVGTAGAKKGRIMLKIKLKPGCQPKSKSKKTTPAAYRILCPECPEKFHTKRDLKSHLKTHAPEKTKSKKKAVEKSKQPRNSKSVVTVETSPIFPCRVCSCSFKSKLAFDIHECLGAESPEEDEAVGSPPANDFDGYDSPASSPGYSPPDPGPLTPLTFDIPPLSSPSPSPENKKRKRAPGSIKSGIPKRGRTSGSSKVKVKRPKLEKEKIVRDDIFTDKKGKRRLKCFGPGCDRIFNRSDRRELHMLSAHPEIKAEHLCEICSESFYTATSLSFHLSGHKKEKSHPCQYCEEKFHSADKLYRHEKTHDVSTIVMKYLCQYCSKSFATKEQVEKHERQVRHDKSESERLKCPQCPKSRIYHSQRSLKGHIAIYHTPAAPDAEPIPPCKVCGKQMPSKRSLVAHETAHERRRDLKYKCKVCEKLFAHKCYLDDHMTKHTGEKKYKCQQCELLFRRSTDRYEHYLRKHVADQDRPFKCKYCSKGFIRAELQLTHERTHTGERPFCCSTCGVTFHSKIMMSHHQRKYHDPKRVKKDVKDVPCPTCNKMFVSKAYMRDHARKMHSNVSTPLPFKCSYCSKGFISSYPLEVHERSHTGEKPFACTPCNSRFRSKESLAVHNKNVHRN